MVDPKQFADTIWLGDLAKVEAMVADGADVNHASDLEQPPLHLAIEQQWVEIVRCLTSAGADVNLDWGWTPLVHAIDIESDSALQRYHEPDRETTDLTEILLSAGAVVTDEALRVARNYQNHKALKLLENYAVRSSSE